MSQKPPISVRDVWGKGDGQWLPSQTRVVVDEMCEKYGMDRSQLIQRVLGWFAQLPVEVRAAVLTREQAMLSPALHAAISAENPVASMDYEQMVATMKTLLDEMTSMHRTAVRVARSMNESSERKKK